MNTIKNTLSKIWFYLWARCGVVGGYLLSVSLLCGTITLITQHKPWKATFIGLMFVYWLRNALKEHDQLILDESCKDNLNSEDLDESK